MGAVLWMPVNPTRTAEGSNDPLPETRWLGLGLDFRSIFVPFAVMRYKAWRSHKDHETHVICREIRQLGPWIGSKEGEIERLKPHYRAMLAEQGFAVVHKHPTEFSPEPD
jgi:hypothetical protein